jgi:hypothetical protein
MEDDKKPKRRYVQAIHTEHGVVKVDRVNSVSGMINRALGIIDEQLIKIALKSRAPGSTLDEKEAKVLQGYIRSLADLSKEEREREKAIREMGDLDKLTSEELLELGQKTLLGLKPDSDPEDSEE